MDNLVPVSSSASFLSTELTEQQILLIEKRIRTAHLPKNFTEQQWRDALVRELIDPNSFNQCHNFLHKLNTILKLAKAGQWLPTSTNIATHNLSVHDQRRKSLQEALAKYQREKISWEHVLQHPAPYQDEVYLSSCRNELVTVNQHIQETTQLLANYTQAIPNNKEPNRAGI